MEEYYVNNEARNFYQDQKGSKKPYLQITPYMRNKDGLLMGD